MPAGPLIGRHAILRRTVAASRSARTRLLPLALMMVAIFSDTDAFARTPVVNSVEARVTREGESELHIRFNTPMNYLSHTPSGRGQTLQIRLRPIVTGGAGDVEVNGRSIHSWNPTPGVPLIDVQYEGDLPGGQTLTLRFSRPVAYTVRSAPDLRSIVVTIRTPAANRNAAATSPPTTTKPAAVPAVRGATPAIDISGRYVINLSSSVNPIDPSSLLMVEAFRGRRLYTTQFSKDGKRWNRLRLGFFPTAGAARDVLGAVSASYPGAWIAKVSAAEKRASAATAIATPQRAAPPPTPVAKSPPVPSSRVATGQDRRGALSEGGLAKLMDEAAIAMTAHNYQRAVLLYTKVLEYPDEPMHRQAQELIGLARERSGQLAHAKAEYETYLQLYPEGEDADRVRQRLAGLLTARSEPQQKLRAAPKEEDRWQTQTYGGLSQYYSHDASSIDGQEETVNRSDLNSNLDLGTRVRSTDYEFGARFNGGYVADFRDQGEDVSRISTLYFETIDRKHGLSSRIGRQSRSTGGVLGRFDGAVIDFQFLPHARLSLTGGFPVDSSTELEVDADRQFYGAALDLGTFAEKWDFNLYAINQDVDGIVDRRAVGGEVRYFNEGRSLFTLVDYDISYDQLNIAILSANWVFKNRATAGLTIDYRNSPSLTTTNALQGQGVEEVSNLLDTLTEDEIRALAEDRTARSRSVTLNASRPLGDSFQISGDVTVTNLSGTDASGGVPATPGTGYEFYYSAQLIGSSLLMKGDANIFGLRYSDASNADTSTLSFDARYPVTRNWRLNPRLRADFKRNNMDAGEQVRVRPSLRTDYRPRNWLRLDLDAGMEWTEDRVPGDTTTTIGYNFMLGYRVNF